jgi:hypothetical protein
MPTPTYDLIQSTTLTSTSSSIVLNTLPTNYENLVLKITTPTTNATAGRTFLRFNSDSGSNYHHKVLGASGTGVNTASENQTYALIGYYSGANSVSIVDIMGYRSSFHKSSAIRYGNNYPESAVQISTWRNTAAITDITVGCLGVYPVNTKVALYGLVAG